METKGTGPLVFFSMPAVLPLHEIFDLVVREQFVIEHRAVI